MKPVVPTTAWTPCSTHQVRLSITASGWVKSTTTCARLGRRPVVADVDRGDQLQALGRLDRPAHLGAHPSAGPEDADLDHRDGSLLRPYRSRSAPVSTRSGERGDPRTDHAEHRRPAEQRGRLPLHLVGGDRVVAVEHLAPGCGCRRSGVVDPEPAHPARRALVREHVWPRI